MASRMPLADNIFVMPPAASPSSKKNQSRNGSGTKAEFKLPQPVKIPFLEYLNPETGTVDMNLVRPKEGSEPKQMHKPVRMDLSNINELVKSYDVKTSRDKATGSRVAVKNPSKCSMFGNEYPPPPKIPKDRGVRKELFRLTRDSVYRSYINKPSKTVHNRKSVMSRKSKKPNETPLTDISIAEKQIFKKSINYPGVFKFKSPLRKNDKHEIVKSKEKCVIGIKALRESAMNNESMTDIEFLKLEWQCSSSPGAGTKATNCSETISSYVRNINILIEEDQRQHEETVKSIKNMLQKIETTAMGCGSCRPKAECPENDEKLAVINCDDKENRTPLRRSKRLSKADVTTPTVAEGATSLRVSTLKKNLNKVVKFNLQSCSPEKGVKQALDLYNSIRNDCSSTLCTPRVSKFGINESSPTPRSSRKLISRTIQQQCLFLQDTPISK